ncbi:MAG: transposase family protein [Blastochloris sp.]|nr:transposase family protein [Blastochloris sp.]
MTKPVRFFWLPQARAAWYQLTTDQRAQVRRLLTALQMAPMVGAFVRYDATGRVLRVVSAADEVMRSSRARTGRRRPAQVQAAHPNHVWAYDFVQDADQHGNTLYVRTVMDAFTREGLATHVTHATSAEGVQAVLAALCDVYGTPTYLRSDNGTEFVAHTLQIWLAQHAIQPLYIDPGCPWQKGKDERFNGTVRDECLNMRCSVHALRRRFAWKHFASSTIVNGDILRSPTKHHWRSSKRGTRHKKSSRILSFHLDKIGGGMTGASCLNQERYR